MSAIICTDKIVLSCRVPRCLWHSKPGDVYDEMVGCPKCAATTEKTALRSTGAKREATRALQISEHAGREERHGRLDQTKMELIETIETLETARLAYMEREVLWDKLQKQDRAEIKRLEAIALRGKNERQWIFNQTIQAMASVLYETDYPEQMSLPRFQTQGRLDVCTSMIKAIDELLHRLQETRSDPSAILFEEGASNTARSCYRAICRAAGYLPRPGTRAAKLYQIVAQEDFDLLPQELAWHTIYEDGSDQPRYASKLEMNEEAMLAEVYGAENIR